MSTFTGNVIAITGASEGIGRAFCLAVAPQGPTLVVAARNAARLESLKTEAEALGAQVTAVPTDVTSEADCKRFIEAAITTHGKLDTLINNAGGTMWSRFEELADLEVFEHLMRTNYLSAVYCTRHALPHLRAARGRLVGVSSVAGLSGVPCRTAYSASKHAMFGFFDSLRIELEGSGVSVTMIAPDFVLSEIHKRAIGPDGKPLGESPMQVRKIMTAATCAELMIDAIGQRKRLLVTSRRGRVARWMKLIAPGMVDRIARKAIEEKK